MISVMNGINSPAAFGFPSSITDAKPFYQKFAAANATQLTNAAAATVSVGADSERNNTPPALATSCYSSAASNMMNPAGFGALPTVHPTHPASQQYHYGYDWASQQQAAAAAHQAAQQAAAAQHAAAAQQAAVQHVAAAAAAVNAASVSSASVSSNTTSPNVVSKAAFLSSTASSGFDMMGPMRQAELYGSNFHAAHAAAAVASGHSWPYGYAQQYPFAAHGYPGAMVADMTGLTGLPLRKKL
ncbi:hypothetical protein AB6A40_005124 [Gnathostoma spinigerum]|uniref:Uncharacterized protein n=1 Tax=Gnathostoma spinigerum TaxID=75299 RepID=A0ABD6EFN1_9BILA